MRYIIKLCGQLLINKDIKAVMYVPADGNKMGMSPHIKNFSIYLYNMLKQVHPDTGSASKAMSIMNSFFNINLSEKLPVFLQQAINHKHSWNLNCCTSVVTRWVYTQSLKVPKQSPTTPAWNEYFLLSHARLRANNVFDFTYITN